MLQKYKIIEYDVAKRQEWGIHKRILLFWYKPLIHSKYVLRDGTNGLAPGCPSREILTFKTEEDAESEVDRLEFGYPPICCRVFQKGKLIKVNYKGAPDGYCQKQTYR